MALHALCSIQFRVQHGGADGRIDTDRVRDLQCVSHVRCHPGSVVPVRLWSCHRYCDEFWWWCLPRNANLRGQCRDAEALHLVLCVAIGLLAVNFACCVLRTRRSASVCVVAVNLTVVFLRLSLLRNTQCMSIRSRQLFVVVAGEEGGGRGGERGGRTRISWRKGIQEEVGRGISP